MQVLSPTNEQKYLCLVGHKSAVEVLSSPINIDVFRYLLFLWSGALYYLALVMGGV